MRKVDRKPARPRRTMRAEYDFAGDQRGRYARRFAEGSNVIVIDPELARLFGGAEGIDRALRSLAELARKQVER